MPGEHIGKSLIINVNGFIRVLNISIIGSIGIGNFSIIGTSGQKISLK